MKNLIVIVLVLALGIFLFTKMDSKKTKAPDTVVEYGNTLKTSRDKAEVAADNANLVIIQSAVNSFNAGKGRFPASLQELVEAGFLGRIPAGDFEYDASSGAVSIKGQ